ncbi:MAG: helix-turn-helix transcriptional regulator [Elusimicrobiota bacterium]
MEEIYTVVGRRIKEIRAKLGITQEKLAELTGLSVAFIGQVERGHNRASLATIQKIADSMRVKVSELFKDVPLNKNMTYTLPNKISLLLKNSSTKSRKDLVRVIRLFLEKNK